MGSPKYFVELTQDGKLHDNVLMTTHDIHAHGTKRLSKRKAYLFPLHRAEGAEPCIILHRVIIPLNRLRIIEGKDAERLAELDEEIRQLQALRAENIRVARLRNATVDDFHSPEEEYEQKI